MRWLTTILLLALVAGSAFWAWKGDAVAPTLGIGPPPPAAASPAADALALLKADDVTALTLAADKDTLSLVRGANGAWTQPGNWPVRQDDAKALVSVLANLKSRFQPIAPDGDLKAYGLDATQKQIVAKLTTGNRTTTLTLGRPAAKPDEPEYARPTFVKVDDHADLLRFDSDLMQVAARKPEEYRRKQLFPEFERVKLTGGESFDPAQPTPPGGRAAVVGNDITSIKIETTDSGLSLKRVAPNPTPKADRDATSEPALAANKLATAWEIDAAGKSLTPLRDRPDPAKLRGLLTAVPELWVEQFLPAKPSTETGLDKPQYVLTVTRAAGPTTLKVGKVSRTVVKDGPPPPPPMPFGAPPPPPPKTTETYHYASIDGLDLLFEVKADKFADLFPKLDDLRDATLARFETDEVTKVEVALKGQPPISLTKKKGNKNADKEDEKQDRWYVGDVLAESGKVTELVDQLAKLEAKNPATPADPLIVAQPKGEQNVLDNPAPTVLTGLGLDGTSSITLTIQEKVPDGQTPPAPRSVKYVLGKHDADKKKLNVQVAGWPRVNVVADDVKKLLDRPALAYRGRRLFDTAELKLTGVTVTRGADTFALAKPDAKWKLTKPLAIDADEAKANQLTGDLSRLEVTEYVDDAPKPEDLDKKYGLTKPTMTVELAFGVKVEKLEIGASPEFKPEYYARRAGTNSVFTVPKATIDSLKDGALAFLPLQLWSVPPDKVTAVEVTRDEGKETYRLTSDAAAWKLTGPFEAPVPFLQTQAVASALSNVRAEKYDAATADPAKHGLDKPALKFVVTYKEAKPDDAKAEVPVTRTLLVGKPAAEPNTRYAKLADGPNAAVFVLNDTLLKDVDKPALELLDKTILNQKPDALTKVQIVGPKADENVTLVKDDKGAWKAEGAAFVPDKPTVDLLLSFLARPPVQELAGYGPAVKWADLGLDKPAYTITGTFTADGKTETHAVKLGKEILSKARGVQRYARIDDGPAAAVLASVGVEALARGKLDFADRTLLTFDAPALNSLVRKKGAEELEIVQGATVGWDMVKPTKLKADQPILDELTEQLSKLRAAKVAAYAPKDLKPFGLDKPTATVTLKVGLDKPTDKVLKLGNLVDENYPDGQRYAMVDGNPTVGVLPGPLATRLLAAPLKFRDRALAKFAKADRIEMTRGDRAVTFAEVNGTWKTVVPVEAEAEQADIDEFINALAKLQADELVAEKPTDLKPFGLDKPAVKWVLKNGANEVLSLLVGAEKGGRVYAKLEKGDLVALLDPSLTAKVTGEYRKRAAWSGVDAAQVEAISVQAGNADFRFTKVGGNWTDAAKPTDRIDPAQVSEFLDALAGLKALRYAADKDADPKLYGLQPPQRIVTITQQGGLTKTLYLGREEGGSGGKRVYARVDEKGRTDVFVLSEADTRKLTKDRAGFVGGK
jgi:hypothetical protein